MNKTLIKSACHSGTMKLALIILAFSLCSCVKPWGKPDPPPAPKQTATSAWVVVDPWPVYARDSQGTTLPIPYDPLKYQSTCDQHGERCEDLRLQLVKLFRQSAEECAMQPGVECIKMQFDKNYHYFVLGENQGQGHPGPIGPKQSSYSYPGAR